MPDQSPIKFGSYTAPLELLQIEGTLSDPFAGEGYEFQGSARYLIEDRWTKARARGSVFRDSIGETEEIMINVVDKDFGRGHLRVHTLESDGKLASSKTEAFIFTNPAFKRAHPMKMKCETAEPKREALWFDRIAS